MNWNTLMSRKCKEWTGFRHCLSLSVIIVLNHLEDPGIDGRIIIRRIFRKWDVGPGLD
jgi:hypothetical protein